MKRKSPKQKAQAATRDWLKVWGIVLSANVAADLVLRVTDAIEKDRRENCPACLGDIYKCAGTPSRHCDFMQSNLKRKKSPATPKDEPG